MKKIGEVEFGANGTNRFETKAIAEQVTPDGDVNLTRKADNQAIMSTSATPKDLNILQSFVKQAHARYGQTPEASPSDNFGG